MAQHQPHHKRAVDVAVAGARYDGDAAVIGSSGSRVVVSFIRPGGQSSAESRQTALCLGRVATWDDVFTFTASNLGAHSILLSVRRADDSCAGEQLIKLEDIAKMGGSYDAIGQEGGDPPPLLSVAAGVGLRVRISLRASAEDDGGEGGGRAAAARPRDPGPMRLHSAVDQALKDVLKSDDPYDQPEFDPVDFLNRDFDSAAALSGLEGFAKQLDARVAKEDAGLRDRVRKQAETARQAERSLEDARESINQLFAKVQEIRKMSEASEAMVKDICTEISGLDHAKDNVEQARDALADCLELMQGLDELDVATKGVDHKGKQLQPDLRRAADKLALCQFILNGTADQPKFSPYERVPRVAQFSQQLRLLTRLVEQQAEGEFQRVRFVDVDAERDAEQLSALEAACKVVDAIGEQCWQRARSTMIKSQIEEYRKEFPAYSDDSRMERMEKRFVWLRRRLKVYEDTLQDIIPPNWCVLADFGVEFCLTTRTDMAQLLEEQKAKGQSLNVEILVRVLQKTIDFEKDLTQRIQKTLPQFDDSGEESPSPRGDSAAAAAARRFQRERRKQTQGKGGNVRTSGKPPPSYKYHGFITSAFEQHMDSYINHESAQMDKMLEEIRRGKVDKETPDAEGMSEALPSAIDMFFYIKDSLKRCANFCKGGTLAQMFRQVWVRHLIGYADFLENQIPPVPPLTHMQVTDYRIICLICNTAEWAQETSMKMAEEVSARIDDGEKKGAVTMNETESVNEDEAPDAFRQVILRGVQQIISNLLEETSSAMDQMVHTDWASLEEVGDQSAYVTDICQALHERFTEINSQLQPGVLRYLCDKFVATFMPRYISSIYKLRRLTGPACQQLLLDLQVLKSLMPDLPNLGNPERFSQKDLRGYNRVIRRDVGRGEGILKFLSADIPHSDPVMATHYAALSKPRNVDGQEQPAIIEVPSIQDFRRLLELKGVPERDQRALEAELRRISPQMQQESDADVALRSAAAAAPSTGLHLHLGGGGGDGRQHLQKDLGVHLNKWKGRGDKFWDKLKTKTHKDAGPRQPSDVPH